MKTNIKIEELKNRQSEYKVPNLIRGLCVLELLNSFPDGLTCSEIAQMLDYPANSAFRITMALQEQGWLLRDSDSKRFFLSQKLLTIGAGVTGEQSLAIKLNDIMKEIREFTGETVLLGVLAENKGVVLEQELSREAFKFQIEPGSSFDLHASAPGKVMLAFNSESDDIIAKLKLKKYTDTTITSKAAFKKVLKEVRKNGFAIDDSEMIEGCNCIAIPVWSRSGRVVGSIWATGPANRFTQKRRSETAKKCTEWVEKIRERLSI